MFSVDGTDKKTLSEKAKTEGPYQVLGDSFLYFYFLKKLVFKNQYKLRKIAG